MARHVKFFPAIDLMGGEAVRLTQGRPESRVTYRRDPVAQAVEFAQQGAGYLHVVDLDAALGQGSNRDLVARLVEASPARVQVGGGLRSLDDIAQLLGKGVWRVVVGSAAIEQPDLVADAVAAYGEAVAVGLDAKDGTVRIRGWQQETSLTALVAAQRMADCGVSTLVVTDIARDGMLGTPDVEGTVGLAQASGCQVVISGGVSTLADLTHIAGHCGRAVIDGVIAGKAIYERRFEVRDALAALER